MKSSIRSVIIPGLVCAVLLLFLIATFTYQGNNAEGIVGFFVRNHVSLMIALTLFSLGTGAALVLLLEREKLQRSAASGTAHLLVSFLSADERTIVDHLARNGGTALQSQLSSLTSFSAVRTHRVLGRLQAKRFLTLERYGKTNKTILATELCLALAKA